MNSLFKHAIRCIACLSCAACSEVEIQDYSGGDALYFYRGTYGTIHVFQQDSIFYSFLVKNKERDTLYLDLRAMGRPVDRPRKISIEQINADAPLAARPGVHYIAFNDPAIAPLMYMPANATAYQVPIVLLRDPGLKQEIVTLGMRIVENEEFKVGLERQSTFQVKFSDQFLPSTNWRPGSTVGWAFVFGEYGQQKHWFLYTYVGFKDFDADVSTYSQGVRKFYNQEARDKLAAYNAANPVLTEADGQVVTFPTL